MSLKPMRGGRSPSVISRASSCGSTNTEHPPRPMSQQSLRNEIPNAPDFSRPASSMESLNRTLKGPFMRATSAPQRGGKGGGNAASPSNASRLQATVGAVRAMTAMADSAKLDFEPSAEELVESNMSALNNAAWRLEEGKRSRDAQKKAREQAVIAAERAAALALAGGGTDADEARIRRPKRDAQRDHSSAKVPLGRRISVARTVAPPNVSSLEAINSAIGKLFTPIKLDTPSIEEDVVATKRRLREQAAQERRNQRILQGLDADLPKDEIPSSEDEENMSPQRAQRLAARHLINTTQAQGRLRDQLVRTVNRTASQQRRERREVIPQLITKLRGDHALRLAYNTKVTSLQKAQDQVKRSGVSNSSMVGGADCSAGDNSHSSRNMNSGGAAIDYVRENRKRAMTPQNGESEKKEEQRHEEQIKRERVFALHEAMLESNAAETEAKLEIVRGEGRDRERIFLSFVTLVSSVKAVADAIKRGKDARLADAAARLTGKKRVSGLRHRRRSTMPLTDTTTPTPTAAGGPPSAIMPTSPLLPDDDGSMTDSPELAAVPERVSTLMLNLQATAFSDIMWRGTLKKRTKAAKAVQLFLLDYAESGTFMRAMRIFLRAQRTTVRCARRYILYHRQRGELLQRQWDHYQSERQTYSRPVCTEAERFIEKMKSRAPGNQFALSASTTSALDAIKLERRRSSAMIKRQQKQSPERDGNSGSREGYSPGDDGVPEILPLAEESMAQFPPSLGQSMSFQASRSTFSPKVARKTGGSMSPSKAASPKGEKRPPRAGAVSPAAATRSPQTQQAQPRGQQRSVSPAASMSRNPLSMSLKAATSTSASAFLRGSQSQTMDKPPPPPVELTPFRRDVLAMLDRVKPFMTHMTWQHPKYGADPVAARTNAMTSLTLSGEKVAMRLPLKVRDFLIRLISEKERLWHVHNVRQWTVDTRAAEQQYDWLQQVAQMQAGMEKSPAKAELEAFKFPERPVRRALLNANEMRLMITVGYAMAAEEKKMMLDVTRVGGSPLEEAASITRQIYNVPHAMTLLRDHAEALDDKLPGIRKEFLLDPPGYPRMFA